MYMYVYIYIYIYIYIYRSPIGSRGTRSTPGAAGPRPGPGGSAWATRRRSLLRTIIILIIITIIILTATIISITYFLGPGGSAWVGGSQDDNPSVLAFTCICMCIYIYIYIYTHINNNICYDSILCYITWAFPETTEARWCLHLLFQGCLRLPLRWNMANDASRSYEHSWNHPRGNPSVFRISPLTNRILPRVNAPIS